MWMVQKVGHNRIGVVWMRISVEPWPTFIKADERERKKNKDLAFHFEFSAHLGAFIKKNNSHNKHQYHTISKIRPVTAAVTMTSMTCIQLWRKTKSLLHYHVYHVVTSAACESLVEYFSRKFDAFQVIAQRIPFLTSSLLSLKKLQVNTTTDIKYHLIQMSTQGK